MHLKSIELHGFKSFANKTVLKFNQGITGIVGPNGSGKSNVADAVRWVLGEQSAKSLRGSKMEDIIFSGTENRKPLGFAYVAITIDNDDRKLPYDADEVTVARRVYRSGESEYLINGRSSRLKDVQELFFDTGIGKEGYSIIGQGQIDKILSGKPEDRRELFDEAAGIVKYKKRKALTEKNLAAEAANLERVSDILSELEKQVGPLERQSKKAKTYLKYRDLLRILECRMYVHEYDRLTKVSEDTQKKLAIAVSDKKETEKSLDSVKEAYAKAEEVIDALTAKIDELRETSAGIRLRKEKAEHAIRLLEEQFCNETAAHQHAVERYAQITASEKAYMDERTQWEQELSKVSAEIQRLKNEKRQAQTVHEAVLSDIHAGRELLESKNSDMIDALNNFGDAGARLQRYDTMLEQVHIRMAQLNQRLLTIKSETDSLDASLLELEQQKAENKKKYQIYAQERERAEEAADTLSEKISTLSKELSIKDQAFHRVGAKLQTLRGISERYEGYANSTRRIMEQKKAFPGILGVTADLISTSKMYETAIETALGGAIQNIVTKDEKTAKALIDYLKRGRLGRATFLPMTSIVPRTLPDADKLMKEPGVLGIASKLVQYDPAYERLADYLLGRVVVADHIDHALILAKKYRYTLKIVTLEGEQLNPGGSLSGGTFKNSGGFLSRHREIEEAQKYAVQLKDERHQLTRQIEAANEDRRSLRQKIDSADEAIKELQISESALNAQIYQLRSSGEKSAKTIDALNKESAELIFQIDEINGLKASILSERDDFEKQKVFVQSEIDRLNEVLSGKNKALEDCNEKIAKLQVSYASCIQKKGFLGENLSRTQKSMEALMREKENLTAQIKLAKDASGLKEKEIAEAKAEYDRQHFDNTEMTDSLNALIKERDEKNVRQKAFFKHREELADRDNLLDKEIYRLEQQSEKVLDDRKTLSSYMWDNYELTYRGAAAGIPENAHVVTPEILKRGIVDMKRSIRELGNVNIASIEEYAEVSDRYELLKQQHDDIVEAEKKLVGIINDLENAMERQFAENFKIIQRNFGVVFAELFGGGKGTLDLSDETDLLNTGVIITAQPPGKKLQNMMQLSGGEKALTAIALLFAIQRLKPSPFCLLDEIEAALDDANVKRYARYLGNLTGDTQFIIITHRRGTMNAADVLYGVTMQEKGVSALVSVSLIENELTK